MQPNDEFKGWQTYKVALFSTFLKLEDLKSKMVSSVTSGWTLVINLLMQDPVAIQRRIFSVLYFFRTSFRFKTAN